MAKEDMWLILIGLLRIYSHLKNFGNKAWLLFLLMMMIGYIIDLLLCPNRSFSPLVNVNKIKKYSLKKENSKFLACIIICFLFFLSKFFYWKRKRDWHRRICTPFSKHAFIIFLNAVMACLFINNLHGNLYVLSGSFDLWSRAVFSAGVRMDFIL